MRGPASIGLWCTLALSGCEKEVATAAPESGVAARQPEYWREDYRSFSHWVPQFGVYAIALSYDRP